jgi:glycosyltransferase involved in cell wall biosynthesis
MAKPIELSIVIPVFNEADNLAELIGRIQSLQLPGAEIIVVDDGSTDGSAEIAMAAGTNVVRHPYNIGNGAAVKSGMRAAKGTTHSLDGRRRPTQARGYSEVVRRGHELSHGGRCARGKGSKLRFHRYVANTVYNLLASYVTRFKVEDLTSGFRLLSRREALRYIDLLPEHFLLSNNADVGLSALRADGQVCADPIALPFRPEQN